MLLDSLKKRLNRAVGVPVRIAPLNLEESKPTLTLTYAGAAIDDWGRKLCVSILELTARGDKAGVYLERIMAISKKLNSVLNEPYAIGLLTVEQVQDGQLESVDDDGQWNYLWRASWRLTMEDEE